MARQQQRRYWLFKSEPEEYSYDDLARDGVAPWSGVRNFQARGFLRDEVKEGDGVLFYHSGGKHKEIVGTAVVVRSGYPDHTAWDPASDHPDPKSTPQNPLWYMVDIGPGGKFVQPVGLETVKTIPALEEMWLLRRPRLSVQPVTDQEWDTIVRMGMKRG
jgi:predicted RNA-binding protein with PUA-like domain